MYGEAGELAHRLCRTATAESSSAALLYCCKCFHRLLMSRQHMGILLWAHTS
jgi:hypothetical protein